MTTRYDQFLKAATKRSVIGAAQALFQPKFPAGTTFILDPGHGGIDAKGRYTTSPNKMWSFGDLTIYEGVENRLCAKALGDKLTSMGAKVIYTVDPSDPTDVPLIYAKTKTGPIGRVWSGNQTKADLFIAIHHNAFNGKISGAEGFTGPGKTKADTVLAEIVSLVKTMHLPASGGGVHALANRGAKEAKFAVLIGSQTHPQRHESMLLELGFFDNRAEAEVIMTDLWRKAWANVISAALLKHYAK